MRSLRGWAIVAASGFAVSSAMVAGGIPAATASTSSARVQLNGSATPASERARPQGAVSGSSSVSFDLVLTLQDAAGAQALLQTVSTPGSATYRHYLTDAQWEARFSPTAAAVGTASAWLRQQGFSVGAVPADRLFVPAVGTAAQVERAFSTSLGNYQVNGKTVRLASGTLSIPASLAATVSGVLGVNQSVATPALTNGATAATSQAAGASQQEPAPPPGFRNPQPCSAYWGEKTDTADAASLYAPYTSPLPYDICGYQPAQLRGAYGLTSLVAQGNDGRGITMAIVDAYDSPTLFSDAQKYFRLNDPAHPLKPGQFNSVQLGTVGNQAACDASGWYDEQALDVEATHAMAPGAGILFVGAQDCFDPSLLAALQTAVTSGASVVSDSWGDAVGDLLEDSAAKTAFDNTFLLAAGTGVSVLFSSGDDGDNFADFGISAPNYPASSPYVTAVGGTTLEVNSTDTRTAELGWSTAKRPLCGPTATTILTTTNCGSATSPAGPLAFQAGGGGGTSYSYDQPFYQKGVVPAALSLRNEALFGPTPLRVEPDISMDADAQSGMLIGLTQTFPTGVKYGQFKEGGTSLASPLLAGVIADADQAAGSPIGFANPVLYRLQSAPGALNDIVSPSQPKSAAVIRVDFANTVNQAAGYVVSLRVIDYQGRETYCDTTGKCANRPVTLGVQTGFDSMTGLGSAGPQFIAALAKL